jgi:hypothetical protein
MVSQIVKQGSLQYPQVRLRLHLTFVILSHHYIGFVSYGEWVLALRLVEN